MVKKTKWQSIKLDLNFNTNSAVNENTNATVELEDSKSNAEAIRVMLPKSTNATRSFEILDTISDKGPFVVELSNVCFEADESALSNLFRDYNVLKVNKYRNLKGKWVIEFKSLDDIKKAIELNGTKFIGRNLNVKVLSEEEFSKQSQFFNNRYGSKDLSGWKSSRSDSIPYDEDDTNWRRSQPLVSNQMKTENSNDNSNWRQSQTVSSKVVKTDISNDNSNWRQTQTMDSSDVKSENNNWRLNKPQIISENSDNWRNKSSTSVNAWKSSKPQESLESSGNWRNSTPKPFNIGNRNTIKSDTNENWRNGSKVSMKSFDESKPNQRNSQPSKVDDSVSWRRN